MEPYYPVNDEKNQSLYSKYSEMCIRDREHIENDYCLTVGVFKVKRDFAGRRERMYHSRNGAYAVERIEACLLYTSRCV